MLSPALSAVRKAHAKQLAEGFYSKIGNKSTTATYQARCDAVAKGLGWATANDVLDRTLTAWKESMQMGRPPRFARAVGKTADTLVLQFTTRGGALVEDIMGGRNSEFKLNTQGGAGRRHYGSYAFRLGPAAADKWATGTFVHHRPLPRGASAGSVLLVRRIVANRFKFEIQLVLKVPEGAHESAAPQKTLAAVHMGWAADEDRGRRIAGVADSADPSSAMLLHLPLGIEEAMERSSELQSRRDTMRDSHVEQLKTIELPVGAGEEVKEELAALQKLVSRPQYVHRHQAHLPPSTSAGRVRLSSIVAEGVDGRGPQAVARLGRLGATSARPATRLLPQRSESPRKHVQRAGDREPGPEDRGGEDQ